MRLPLTHIAARCDPVRLQTVELELTPQDLEDYDRTGWKDYHPDNHRKTLLPELGEPLHFRTGRPVVVGIKGRRYRVSVEDTGTGEPFEPGGKCLVLEETTDPPTPPDGKDFGHRHGHYYRFFGQPVWVQGPHYPADPRGNPCFHFLTVENHWGDCGNWNILVGLDEAGVPDVAYFEASCC